MSPLMLNLSLFISVWPKAYLLNILQQLAYVFHQLNRKNSHFRVRFRRICVNVYRSAQPPALRAFDNFRT